jgi:hypothetical protein
MDLIYCHTFTAGRLNNRIHRRNRNVSRGVTWSPEELMSRDRPFVSVEPCWGNVPISRRRGSSISCVKDEKAAPTLITALWKPRLDRNKRSPPRSETARDRRQGLAEARGPGYDSVSRQAHNLRNHNTWEMQRIGLEL